MRHHNMVEGVISFPHLFPLLISPFAKELAPAFDYALKIWHSLKMKALSLLILTSASSVLARLHLPRATSAEHVSDSLGFSARPTPPPNYELVKRKLHENIHLAKRASTLSSGEFLGYIGPDNTCGYVNGQLGKETCPSITFFI